MHAAGKSIKLARGDFFGEMALLLAQPRQANVTALSYCLLLTLEDEDFQALLKGSKGIRSRIDAAASARQKMNEAVQQLKSGHIYKAASRLSFVWGVSSSTNEAT